jgi:hypothetical protein
MIFSLFLAGTCIMEFRKYTKGTWRVPSVVNGVDEDSSQELECIRKAMMQVVLMGIVANILTSSSIQIPSILT